MSLTEFHAMLWEIFESPRLVMLVTSNMGRDMTTLGWPLGPRGSRTLWWSRDSSA